ncbi:MAG TPA: RNA 2',3'-cyclic phosphodiesterase [Gemmatimonadaceae bacterium]|nr:RNA 2',3'-cyclic phosphodiesterase [Gemmatimonadaceae bacterium]
MPDQAGERPERLFIGVPLTEDTRRSIARALPRSLPGKLVPVENWHFTLRFLGATKLHVREKLVKSLADAAYPWRFDIVFNALGAFPNPRRARVLWLGADEGEEKMVSLAAIAEAAARSAGFAAESRAFTAHLTLCRLDPPASVTTLLASKPRFDTRMTVDRIVLFRSRLGGGPARYEEVESFPLG